MKPARFEYVPAGTVEEAGASYDGGSFQGAIHRALELVGYDALRARQQALRAEGRYLGIGVSPFVEQGGWAARSAAVNGFPGFSYLDSVSSACWWSRTAAPSSTR